MKKKRKTKKHSAEDQLNYMQLLEDGMSATSIVKLYGGDRKHLTVLWERYKEEGAAALCEKRHVRLSPIRLILHSNQGWHYQHAKYQKMLAQHGIIQSMSRKGNCLDNSIMENFFGAMKNELLYVNDFESIEHFENELKHYIDWYNNERIKLRLNGLSPVLDRTQGI